MINKKWYYFFVLGVMFLFAFIVFLILRSHTDLGFWYQSDILGALALVQDVFISHHSVFDWSFAPGETQLLCTLPFIILSFFTHNTDIWLIGNACFLLTMYVLLFIALGKVLFSHSYFSLLLPISALVSLSLLAAFLQVPFTLDLLLVAGQHEELVLFTVLCLMLMLIKLKHPDNIWALPLLFICVFLEALFDQIFIASFVVPGLATLLCVRFFLLPRQKKQDIFCLIIIMSIIFTATISSRLAWLYLPLSYGRQGATLIFNNHVVQWTSLSASTWGAIVSLPINFFDIVFTVVHYWGILFVKNPIYLSVLAFAFFLLLAVLVSTRKSVLNKAGFVIEKNGVFIAIFFIFWECIFGFLRFFVTRHLVSFYAAYSLKESQFLNFPIHGFTWDGIDFFILPIFLGIPIVIGYLGMFLAKTRQKTIVITFGVASFFFIVVMLGISIAIIRHADSYRDQKKNAVQLMHCLLEHISQNELHAGVADYWIDRPIIFLSNHQVFLSALSSAPGAAYEHYVSSWSDIRNKNIDYWVVRYDKFFRDPVYANYYDVSLDVKDKLKHFGLPDGQFICRAKNGTWLQVYFYKHHQIMKSLLPSIRQEGKSHAYINSRHEISW